MKTPVRQGTSAAKAGWLILLLLFGWLAFVFVPLPWKETPPAPVVKRAPPSKLQQAGLRDYTDWEGLPEIFTVWADKGEWKDGRTKFAYWNPATKSYSYYFEASRVKAGFRFKEITEPHEADHSWDESLGDDCPIRFYRTLPALPVMHLMPVPAHYSHDADPAGVKLDVKPSAVQLPQADLPPVEPTQKL